MSKKGKKVKKTVAPAKVESNKFHFVFGKKNYMFMLIGLGVMILGFVLMYGGTEDIYNTRKITIAPIVVLIGLIIEVYAIFLKSPELHESN